MGRQPKSNLHPELIDLLKQIGANLIEVRNLRGVTQAWLAEKSRVSITTVNEIETKRFRDIRLSTLVALATCLDVSVARLMHKSDVKLISKDQMKLLKASEEILRITKKLQDRD